VVVRQWVISATSATFSPDTIGAADLDDALE
jgi:hypothetical protein